MTYIEREALLEKRQTVGICDAAGNYYGAADVVFVEDIEKIPAADVMPVVHAEWEKHSYVKDDTVFGRANMYWYRCSNCKQPRGISESPYCPNCGAKMLED